MGEQGKQTEKHASSPERIKKPAVADWGELSIEPGIRPQIDRILYLQRTIGNQAVTRWLDSPTDRMDIGQPGVRYQRGPLAVQLVPEEGQGTGGETSTAGAEGGGGGVGAPQTEAEARVVFNRARFAFEGHNFDEALRLFQMVRECEAIPQGHRDMMLANIAQCQASMGDFEGAQATLEQYRQSGLSQPTPESLEQTIEQIRAQGGAAGGEEVAMPENEDEARQVFQRGREAGEAGNWAEAARLFQAVLNAPDLSEETRAIMIYNVFNAQIRCGDFEQAEATLEQYRATGSSTPPVEHMEQMMQRFRAESETRVPEEGPQTDEQARVVFYRARDAFNGGNYAEALRLFEAVITAPGLEPDHVTAVGADIAICEAHLGNRDAAMTAVLNYGELLRIYGGEVTEEQLRERVEAILG